MHKTIEYVKNVLENEMEFKVTKVEPEGTEDTCFLVGLTFTKTKLRMALFITVERDTVIIDTVKIINKVDLILITKKNMDSYLKQISEINNYLKFGKFLLGLNENNEYELNFRAAFLYEEEMSEKEFKKALHIVLQTVSKHAPQILR